MGTRQFAREGIALEDTRGVKMEFDSVKDRMEEYTL